MRSIIKLKNIIVSLKLCVSFFLISCGTGQTAVRVGPVTAVLPDKTLAQNEPEIVPPKSFLILTPGTFHNEDLPVLDSSNWTGLFIKDGKAQIEDIDLIVSAVHDPILDHNDEKTAKKIDSSPQDAQFIINGLSKGSVIIIDQNVGSIFPAQDYSFEYYGRAFNIKATAKNIGENGDFSNLLDYQLLLTAVVNAEERTQVLAATYQFDDAEMSILFIGDLDRDGWPDLIVNTSPKYSYSQIMLFLSSEAEGKDLVKPVATFRATGC